MRLSSVAILLLLVFAGCACVLFLVGDGFFSAVRLPTAYETSIFVVDLTEVPDSVKLAASVSAGLLNKHFNRPAVYTLLTPTDKNWRNDLQGSPQFANSVWDTLTPADLIAYAIGVGAATGTIVYDTSEPWSLANVVTLCGIESAIPIPTQGLIESDQNKGNADQERNQRSELISRWASLSQSYRLRLRKEVVRKGDNVFFELSNTPLLRDVAGVWKNNLDAGLYAWAHLLPNCENTEDTVVSQRPELLSQGYLADLIVAKQMFVFFLPEMCVDGPQQLLYRNIADKAYSAGKQLKVMGYNTPNEVVADCSIHHTEISLVSDWSPNLSFLSRMQAQTEPYRQNTYSPAPVFNPNNTYIAVINSDGDNMQMENNGNRPQMEERVRICTTPGSICPPLAWTISNNLMTYAPYLLEWYYRQASKTGKDSFLMGPSGFGFLHPAALQPDSPLLKQFVYDTVEAAEKLAMTSYVHWDIDGNDLTQALRYPVVGWNTSQVDLKSVQKIVTNVTEAVKKLSSAQRASFLKRYDGSQIDTIFAPGEYNIPSWSGNVAGIDEQYRWFKGTNIQDVISTANSIPRGTIGYIYKIFDVDMNDLEAFAAQVAGHVKLVDHRQMHDVALQKKLLAPEA